jgi:hypothetical protein
MAGFAYQGTDSQGDISGKVKAYSVDAAHAGLIGLGDLVVVTGTAVASGKKTVDIGTANTANTGVVSGVKPNFEGEALSTTWLPATTAGVVYVNCDTYALYLVDVANGPLAVADVGLNCPAVVTAGTVSGGLFTSNMKANATGKATTATLPLNIVELREDDDGVLGNRAIVRMNATTMNIGATGI